MLRSAPGRSTWLPATRTVPSLAGWCGRSPAMSRSTVDLPHPDGPRIAMNSPLLGRSGTANVTSRMTVWLPKRFVTFLNSTTLPSAAGAVWGSLTSVLDRTIGEQPALEPEQHPVDAVREQADDDQDQDDVLRQAAPLARHQEIAQPVFGVDQLGQHD